MNDRIAIRTDLKPGDLGRLITLHGIAYLKEENHFGLTFEAHVARTVAEFILDNGGRGRVWLAEAGGDLVGCAAMVDRGDRGQLRWVVVKPDARGTGLGKKLVHSAIEYAQSQGWRAIFLETTDGLDASMDIYSKLGFRIAGERKEDLWGGVQNVITMVKEFD